MNEAFLRASAAGNSTPRECLKGGDAPDRPQSALDIPPLAPDEDIDKATSSAQHILNDGRKHKRTSEFASNETDLVTIQLHHQATHGCGGPSVVHLPP